MKFLNRADAGRQIAGPLEAYFKHSRTIVLGLPRGGVPVAHEVAQALHLPLDVICPHKIGAPMNPEYAIAAVTEYGQGLFSERAIQQLGVSQEYLNREVARRAQQARQRLKLYRNDPTPREVKGKIVILVDDGLATGLTMKAAIHSIQTEEAARAVVAVPVAPPESLAEIESLVDEVVCLYVSREFVAVGQFYDDFRAITDEEVIECLRQART